MSAVVKKMSREWDLNADASVSILTDAKGVTSGLTTCCLPACRRAEDEI